MLNKTLVAVVIGSSLVGSSFAGNLMEKLLPNSKLDNPLKSAVQKRSEVPHAQPYTNFSGKWQGSCSSNENPGVEVEIDPITIENSADWIEFDGEHVSINTVNHESSNRPDFYLHSEFYDSNTHKL